MVLLSYSNYYHFLFINLLLIEIEWSVIYVGSPSDEKYD